jgi:predicted transcriptional regulator
MTRPATVADAMIGHPHTLGVEITVADARLALADTHVHMLLLTRGGVLHGTLVRGDLLPELDQRRPAVTLALLAGRTIGPDRSLDEAMTVLDRTMARRLAVTDSTGTLLGLLCLNRTRQRFCTEADVRARTADRRGSVPGAGQRM